MMMDAAALDQLFAACAPAVGRNTIAAIVRVESGGRAWAVHDNKDRRSYQPASAQEAARLVRRLIADGHSVDIGLAQINSRNLDWLGLSVEEVLKPCANVRAGGFILGDCYERAAKKYGSGQLALRHALSCYNTGSFHAGGKYVDKVLAAAGVKSSSPYARNQVSLHPAQRAHALPLMLMSNASWRVF